MTHSSSDSTSPWPWVTIAVITLVMIAVLRGMGRVWTSETGAILLWVGQAQGLETSQQLTDPYSFTHLLHGVAFFWLLALVTTWSIPWRLAGTLFLEGIWEVIENTPMVIERYRQTGIEYFGDSILNSTGDLLCCAAGFLLTQWIGVKRSILIFCTMEAALLFTIRDSLSLNIVMLIRPVDGVKTWQTGGSSPLPLTVGAILVALAAAFSVVALIEWKGKKEE